jgi:hypothetical protein
MQGSAMDRRIREILDHPEIARELGIHLGRRVCRHLPVTGAHDGVTPMESWIGIAPSGGDALAIR